MAVPHGIIFNVIGIIAQALLRVDNPDQDFRYLPVAPDLNNKREKSYFGGLSCHQFYEDLLKKSLKAYIDDDKVIEGCPRIFSVLIKTVASAWSTSLFIFLSSKTKQQCKK